MIDNNLLSILVMSCDKYSGIWNDFFNLKDKFWPDCPFKTYLATDTKFFKHNGVTVINFGDIRDWTRCVRESLLKIDTPYVCLWLEDALICEKIDTKVICEDLLYAVENKVKYLCIEIKRRFDCFVMEEMAPHLLRIDPHQRYGVDTAVAIWEKKFFLDKLSKDCNPWQFEVDRCVEAATPQGIEGLAIYDERHPANISPVEILRRGKLRPQAIKYMNSIGYSLNLTEIPVMTHYEIFKEWCRNTASKISFGKSFLKAIGKKLGFFVYTVDE